MYNAGNPQYQDTPLSVKEIGNKVYIYGGDNPQSGKYVQVFSKDPQESMADAITRQVLHGYSLQDCLVKPANLEKRYLTHSNYQYMQVTTPYTPNQSYDTTSAEAQKCPEFTYTRINGVSYFMMDTNHPDKLLFVKLGMDNIGSVQNKPNNLEDFTTWDQSLKVLQ